MPDYLEELLDNAEALLEQVRRMERGGSGPASLPDHSAREELRRALDAASGTGETESSAVRAGPAENAVPEPPGRAFDPQGEKAGNRESSALLEQLERLERAAGPELGGGGAKRSDSWGGADGWRRTAFFSGPAGVWREIAYPDAVGAAGDGWSLNIGPARPSPAAGELQWAEQADRVFRRDSRRYDGGFYLY